MAGKSWKSAGASSALAGVFCGLITLGCGKEVCSEEPSASSQSSALGTTYQIGPGKAYSDFSGVVGRLVPGDVVEVYPRATPYPGDLRFARAGTAAQKITVRGVRVGGVRPVISGGTNTVVFDGNHYVLEGFEIIGGSFRNVFHHAHDVTIRDTSIHDCKGHGILGADSGAGSLTLQRVEVYACGEGTQKHPVYMATDETVYPGAVFRMEHSYLHDQRGGNAIKSRAERNEIYSNWIEGALYREIELIGPDGQAAGLKREDSDVVGNVFYKTVGTYVARIGGDGTGATAGRYRFVNNTFILQASSSAVIQAFDAVESVEMSNNVFFRVGGGGVEILRDSDASWTTGRRLVSGQNNWVPNASTNVPADWIGTLRGSDPGFVNLGGRDLRPAAGSGLVDRGIAVSVGPAGRTLPSPRLLPLDHPPLRATMAAAARPKVGAIDIGAFEFGVAAVPPPKGDEGGAGSPGAGGDDAPGDGGADGEPPSEGSGGAAVPGGLEGGGLGSAGKPNRGVASGPDPLGTSPSPSAGGACE